MVSNDIAFVVGGIAFLYCLWFTIRTLSGSSETTLEQAERDTGTADDDDLEKKRSGDPANERDPETTAAAVATDPDQSNPESSSLLGWFSLNRLLIGAFVTVGIVSVSAAGIILWRPTALQSIGYQPPHVGPDLGRQIRYGVATVALSGCIGLYGIWRVLGLSQSSSVQQIDPPVETPPEVVGSDPKPTPNQAIDHHFTAFEGTPSVQTRQQLHDELENAALEAIVEFGGYEPPEAQARITAGEWTNDTRAAAYLGGSEAPTPHWRTELWDWLRVEPRNRRRARHVVAAIEAYVANHDRSDHE